MMDAYNGNPSAFGNELGRAIASRIQEVRSQPQQPHSYLMTSSPNSPPTSFYQSNFNPMPNSGHYSSAPSTFDYSNQNQDVYSSYLNNPVNSAAPMGQSPVSFSSFPQPQDISANSLRGSAQFNHNNPFPSFSSFPSQASSFGATPADYRGSFNFPLPEPTPVYSMAPYSSFVSPSSAPAGGSFDSTPSLDKQASGCSYCSSGYGSLPHSYGYSDRKVKKLKRIQLPYGKSRIIF
ncbi:hypothetical protein WR25_14802 [Diploscapter pachys]|uniref:Uncharacterized protein n=1 Tax=Diploscapter pachys TaxID=2018661 RepID=A0A2A2JGZ8_9BILA|nr:hypothetical protein WR25_14802 [Diploscapter pachys]